MAQRTDQLMLIQIGTLLHRYGFELRGSTTQVLIERWLGYYSASWIRLAVVEALYQGRYKAISVEHILSLWLRRGQANFHFTHEFERLICRNLPHYFPSPVETVTEELRDNDMVLPPTEIEIADILIEWNQRLTEKESRFNPMPLESLKISSTDSSERSIHQFTPLLDSSELYVKLRSVISDESSKIL